MRPMYVFFGVIVAVVGTALTPTVASQSGQHAKPSAAPTHRTEPSHPAKSATHASAAVPLEHRLAANPALSARLQPLVPSGMTLANAAMGFKNQGQFIAALHVSHNLNIPFEKLKAELTGPEHDSLGKAIHDLQPTADAKAAMQTAEQQARADVKLSKPAKTDADKDRKTDTDKDRKY